MARSRSVNQAQDRSEIQKQSKRSNEFQAQHASFFLFLVKLYIFSQVFLLSTLFLSVSSLPDPYHNYKYNYYKMSNQGYYQQGPPQMQGAPPPQGGYYQQQPQPVYVQQPPQEKKDGGYGCCGAYYIALCACCALDALC